MNRRSTTGTAPARPGRNSGRRGVEVVRDRVARLMRQEGLEVSDPWRRDLLQRDFTATRPNEKWVADLTYVCAWQGFVRQDHGEWPKMASRGRLQRWSKRLVQENPICFGARQAARRSLRTRLPGVLFGPMREYAGE